MLCILHRNWRNEMPIQSFSCDETRSFFETGANPKFTLITHVASRKLGMLDSAKELSDLRGPGASLHKLNRDKKGKLSIKINDKYRICFTWTDEGPAEVEILDYH